NEFIAQGLDGNISYLSIVCRHNCNLEIIKYLIELGDDINKDISNQVSPVTPVTPVSPVSPVSQVSQVSQVTPVTPFLLAFIIELDHIMNIELLEFLIDNGCDIDALIGYITPLQYYITTCSADEKVNDFFKRRADTTYALNYITLKEIVDMDLLNYFAGTNNN